MKRVWIYFVVAFVLLLSASCGGPNSKILAEQPERKSATQTAAPGETLGAQAQDESVKQQSLLKQSLVRYVTDPGKIRASEYAQASLAIDPDPHNLLKDCDWAVLARVKSREAVRYLSEHSPLPYTFISLELLDTLKGESKGLSSIGIQGGTLLLQDYLATKDEAWQKKYGMDGLSQEEKETTYVELFSNDYVDIVEGETYLFFLNWNAGSEDFIQDGGGYSVYRYDESDGSISNPLMDLTLDFEAFKKG